jgi:hypothetical protein
MKESIFMHNQIWKKTSIKSWDKLYLMILLKFSFKRDWICMQGRKMGHYMQIKWWINIHIIFLETKIIHFLDIERVGWVNCKKHQIHLADIQQGSVLGPLFFLLYINDITYNLETLYWLYVDDTTYWKTFKLDQELANKFKSHPYKTEAMF